MCSKGAVGTDPSYALAVRFPVPFTMIGGAAMANPNDPGATAKAIWSMLGVTVTANQP